MQRAATAYAEVAAQLVDMQLSAAAAQEASQEEKEARMEEVRKARAAYEEMAARQQVRASRASAVNTAGALCTYRMRKRASALRKLLGLGSNVHPVHDCLRAIGYRRGPAACRAGRAVRQPRRRAVAARGPARGAAGGARRGAGGGGVGAGRRGGGAARRAGQPPGDVRPGGGDGVDWLWRWYWGYRWKVQGGDWMLDAVGVATGL